MKHLRILIPPCPIAEIVFEVNRKWIADITLYLDGGRMADRANPI
jgi:hypothetical protein